MTVEELIERLQDLPPKRMNNIVYIPDETGPEPVERVVDHPPMNETQTGYYELR